VASTSVTMAEIKKEVCSAALLVYTKASSLR